MNSFRPTGMAAIKQHALRHQLRRSGVTLVELIVALGVASVMLMTALSTIHLLLHAERESIQSAYRLTTLNRLSRIFRSDIHSASNPIIEGAEGSTAKLTLTLPNAGSITYSIDNRQVFRTANAGNGPLHREEFRLPIGANCRFEKLADPERIRLVVATPRRSEKSISASRSAMAAQSDLSILTMEAVPARDLRFEGPK